MQKDMDIYPIYGFGLNWYSLFDGRFLRISARIEFQGFPQSRFYELDTC